MRLCSLSRFQSVVIVVMNLFLCVLFTFLPQTFAFGFVCFISSLFKRYYFIRRSLQTRQQSWKRTCLTAPTTQNCRRKSATQTNPAIDDHSSQNSQRCRSETATLLPAQLRPRQEVSLPDVSLISWQKRSSLTHPS